MNTKVKLVNKEKIEIKKNEELMLIIKQYSNLSNGRMNEFFKDDEMFSKVMEKSIIQMLSILKVENFIEFKK